MARYIEILFRFKFRFAVLLVLLPALVGGVTVVLFPSYKASAQLWVDNPSYFGNVTPTGWSQYLTPAQNEADSLTQILSTGAFGRELYRRLANDIPDDARRQQVVIASKINVFSTGSHLMDITASCSVRSDCILLVNTAVAVLRDLQIQSEKAQAQSGVTYITAQLKDAKTSLSASEDAMRRYIVMHPGAKVDIGADPATIPDPELSRIAADVQTEKNTVNDLQDQLNRDNNILKASTALIEAGPRVVDPPQVIGGRLGDGTALKKAGMTGGGTLALGLVYLFLLSWLDKTLRDPREIEHRFKVPVVAAIPELSLSERF
jgi:capsular polysaccharide biosynthesis protein